MYGNFMDRHKAPLMCAFIGARQDLSTGIHLLKGNGLDLASKACKLDETGE